MSCEYEPGTGGFRFIWRIENFSKCALEEEESLTSPKFVVADMQNTAWYLSLYPRHTSERKEYVTCYLFRDTVDGGPRSISVSYYVTSVKTKERYKKELAQMNQMEFKHGQSGFQIIYLNRKKIFDNRSLFLPKDTLIIECHLQKDTIFKMAQVECTATTRITVERIHFTWAIKNFLCNSVGVPENYERVIHPVTKAKNPPSITVKLRFHDTDTDAMKVHLSKNKNRPIFVAFKLSLIDVNNTMHDFCTGERFMRNKDNEWVQNPTFTRQLSQERSIFVVNNKLSVHCEFELSFGLIAYAIEQQKFIPPAEFQQQRVYNPLTTDLRSMFVEQKFCDVSFRVRGRTLGAHRLILCARSPVFSAMFGNDMREKRDDSVDIDDLDYDTLHGLLMFLYTDEMEQGVGFESVLKLYGAADKYQVASMRGKCVALLEQGISVDNFCEVLAAADLHRDDKLADAVKNFMTSHLQEIMTWSAWKDFMANNFLLAVETLRQLLNETADN